MSGSCFLLNQACRLLYTPAYKKFLGPCRVGQVQERYLRELLQKNRETVYGRRYGFDKIRSYQDFAQALPLTVYEDYLPYLERMAAGEKNVLTRESPRLFELTSGSASGKKLIPYTNSLEEEFQRGIRPWLCDIYTKCGGITRGKSYWSITPVTAGKKYSSAGIPIGFEEDTEYFGRLEGAILKRLFAVDSSVKFCQDTEDFYRRTAFQLLSCQDLTLISVWSPSFLTILCDYMVEHAQQLGEALAKAGLERRAKEILPSLRAGAFPQVFPQLKLISCWADGSAKAFLPAVEARFPGVEIQPKGLLATECFVSFPLLGEEGSRLSVYSHFFEFRSVKDGKIYPASQLAPGEYELIVTTGGGFYRYCIGDMVQVLKTFPDRPPLLRFLGRKGATSDLCGEKLTESFVAKVLDSLKAQGYFCLLAPRGNRYCLYTTARHITGNRLDKELCQSFHYQYCRQLGQLKEALVAQVEGSPERAYLDRLRGENMRMGDIKPALLSPKDGWENWFQISGREEELC